MGRFAVALGSLCLLVCGGAAAVLLDSGPAPAASTTSVQTTTTTSTVAAVPTTTVASTAASVLAVSGHGWGHGLGLSQWGAYGYAKHGWTYDRILAHYYAGTTLGTAAVPTVRVLVAEKKKATISSVVPWTVQDASGAKTQLAAGPLALTPKLRVAADATAVGPLTFSAAQPLLVDGHAYRGKLVVSADGKNVDVIDVVSLEDYVKGVVPAEMPSTWPAQALEAQAVAARSYALANLAKGKPFDLYDDTRSQEYGGAGVQVPSTDAAVDATKGQVVTYHGKVADTLFFSTSGGRTASSLEATGILVPYLVPEADPYDTLSPYHDWGPVLFDAAKVAKQLKLAGPIADVTVANGPSGRVKTMAVTTRDGQDAVLTGNQVRAALALNSTWFTPSLLQLSPAAKTMTYGGAVSLTGLVRGVDAVSLEAKQAGATMWSPAGALVPDAAGSFSVIEKPLVTTSYRLAWGNVRAGLAKISVAARVAAEVSGAAVQGSVRPSAAGAPVQLQQQGADGKWATVSSAVTDAASGWSFAGVAAGTYRVRVAPGHGIVAGVSPTVTVQ
ncbi:MAG TPA: SpoIID/LytB domain-containing protein [Gaiellaceae bacterium]|nr:SpoIID/LytB domain-containing protein [Gaiellaceae bacterium]